MSQLPPCPKCNEDYSYEERSLLICPMCGHEWSPHPNEQDGNQTNDQAEPSKKVYKDANGEILIDGDTVTVIKDLKVKGSSSVVKIGTKVKNIRLIDGDHDIDCNIKGIGAMQLKTQFVKKVKE